MAPPSPPRYTFLRLRTLAQEKALRTHITIDGKQYGIRQVIQSGTLRCTKCPGFGHLWKGCNKPKKGVRCSGPNCEVGDCKKKHYENVVIAGGGGGGSAAMKKM